MFISFRCVALLTHASRKMEVKNGRRCLAALSSLLSPGGV
jgi:hypothetical protein